MTHIHQSGHCLRNMPHHASILWLLVLLPCIKLLRPARLSLLFWRKNSCKNSRLVFSVPKSQRSILHGYKAMQVVQHNLNSSERHLQDHCWLKKPVGNKNARSIYFTVSQLKAKNISKNILHGIKRQNNFF
jgi:hypothetical protein